MPVIHTVDQPPVNGIRVPPADLRGVRVLDFLRRAQARGLAVAQHRAAFYLVRLQ